MSNDKASDNVVILTQPLEKPLCYFQILRHKLNIVFKWQGEDSINIILALWLYLFTHAIADL